MVTALLDPMAFIVTPVFIETSPEFQFNPVQFEDMVELEPSAGLQDWAFAPITVSNKIAVNPIFFIFMALLEIEIGY
jgi:hypothetical protein